MKTKIALFLLIASLAGCQRMCSGLDHSIMDSHPCKVTQFSSDGKIVGHWEFRGIVNSSNGSDEYYFNYDDSLIEISGTVQIVIDRDH